MREVTTILLVALGLAVWPLAAGAQDGETAPEGRLYIGLDFLSSHIGADDPTATSPPEVIYVDEVGAGGAFTFGYCFSPVFQLRMYISGAEHDATDPDYTFRFAGGTIEALYLFRPGQPLRPYVFGGLGGFNVKTTQDAFEYETSGPGMVLGGGLYYFLGRNFGLHFGLRGEFISWDEATARLTLPNGSTIETATPIEESGAAGKFTLGAAVRF